MRKYCLLIWIAALFWGDALMAQPELRDEDHFWRKRVVRRIDLKEKMNRPLAYHESGYYSDGHYTQRNGVVAALVSGLQNREYVAYHPDDWNKTMDYEALVKRMMEFEEAWQGQEEIFEETEDNSSDLLEEFGLEDKASEDDWGGFEFEEIVPIEEKVDLPEDYRGKQMDAASYQIDYGQYEESFHIVEDWIFNKARSSMQQNIDYFEIIWTDPSGMLPEKVLARFRWDDSKELLAHTQWKNRFNDAEVRSMKEVFELRIFHGYLIDIGGVPIRSLAESHQREMEMIEFEHHLWSY